LLLRLRPAQGRFDLGSADDPESQWTFGRKDELFKYRLVGMHMVSSSMTALMTQQAFDASTDRSLGQWDAFRRAACKPNTWPEDFLFAGCLESCASASVYLHEGRDGLLISSNYEYLGA